MRYVTTLVFLAAAAYATLRYNVFKGVPWSDWSTYVMNKAVALSALAFMALEVFRSRRYPDQGESYFLRIAGLFAATHVFLSLMLLSPAYYEKLYQQDKLTVSAGMSLALGAVTAAAMSLGAIRSRSSSTDGVVNDLAVLCFVIGLHAMLIGFAGWFAPLKWPGLMPPITLISFLLGTAALASGLWPGRKFSDSHTNKPSDHTD